MSKPFQFSLARLLVAVALIGTGLESLSLLIRQNHISGWTSLGLVFKGWALFAVSFGVLFRFPIVLATVLALSPFRKLFLRNDGQLIDASEF
jgi:hypothetical protein